MINSNICSILIAPNRFYLFHSSRKGNKYPRSISGKKWFLIITHSEYNHCVSPAIREWTVLMDIFRSLAISAFEILFLFSSASKLFILILINLYHLLKIAELRYFILSILHYCAFVNTFLRNIAIFYLHLLCSVVISF